MQLNYILTRTKLIKKAKSAITLKPVMNTKVTIEAELLDMILEGARRLHPKETIVLLRGKAKKDVISVSDVLIPPLASYGHGFSGFPRYMLPMDFTIIGTAHSHPSGNPKPSPADQNHLMGKIMLIVAFPYRGKEDAVVYDRAGETLVLEVT